MAPNTSAPLTLDFGSEGAGRNWQIINDGVMGGRSQGRGTLTDSSLVFEGQVSLENNGGFASLRAPYDTYDLSGYTEVRVRCRTRGQSFALVLENSRRWYDVNYKVPVQTEAFAWETLTLKLSDFEAYQVGRPRAETLDAATRSEIIRFGFITNDKRATAFTLEIDWLEFR